MAKRFISTRDDADNYITLEINDYNSTYTLTIEGKTVETGTFEKLAKRLRPAKTKSKIKGGGTMKEILIMDTRRNGYSPDQCNKSVHNGQLVIAQPDNGVCYKCGGSGMMQVTETIRTPEEQARYEKAKARREAKAQAKREAEEAARKEAQRIAEEARLEAERQKEAERIANLHRGYGGHRNKNRHHT
jgi:hypothetical protein